MSLQPLIPALIALLALSVAVMTWAASIDAQAISLLAAAGYGLAVVAVAWRINRPEHWPAEVLDDPVAPMHTARRNARLFALTYAWGGLALLMVYKLSGLKWQHGWQYGSGMAVIAGGLLVLVHKLGDEGTPLRTPAGIQRLANLALAQAIAAAFGLVFLIGAGKLWAGKKDWAANHVFLVGGVTIAIVSLIAWRTHAKLMRRVE